MSVNIPLLLIVSVLPDIDLLIPSLEHRGPTHSIIIFSLLFLPLFLKYGTKATPYFMALMQHSLIGDCLIGGAMIVWPLTSNWYGLGIAMKSPAEVSLEWVGFLTSLAVMIQTKDILTLFKPHKTNLLLFVPAIEIYLSIFLKFGYTVPLELVIPHVVYLVIFVLSILVDLKPRRGTSVH